jgi:hypothetical protein
MQKSERTFGVVWIFQGLEIGKNFMVRRRTLEKGFRVCNESFALFAVKTGTAAGMAALSVSTT